MGVQKKYKGGDENAAVAQARGRVGVSANRGSRAVRRGVEEEGRSQRREPKKGQKGASREKCQRVRAGQGRKRNSSNSSGGTFHLQQQ